MYIYMRVFFGKGTLLENNLYESDTASHQKEDILNEDWSEFILCDWNQLLGSKVFHTESGDPARTKVESRHTVTCGSSNQGIQTTTRCESASSKEICGR